MPTFIKEESDLSVMFLIKVAEFRILAGDEKGGFYQSSNSDTYWIDENKELKRSWDAGSVFRPQSKSEGIRVLKGEKHTILIECCTFRKFLNGYHWIMYIGYDDDPCQLKCQIKN